MKTTLAHEPRHVPRAWMLMLALCASFAGMALLALLSSPSADALATVGPPSTFSSTAGLPDGRVYEEVSPPDKNGFSAGIKTQFHNAITYYGMAGLDGNAMVYWGNGPMGEDTHFGLDSAFVARRTVGVGWRTKSVTPRPLGIPTQALLRLLQYSLLWLDTSEDLTHAAFTTASAYAPRPDESREEVGGTGGYTNSNLFFAGPDPSVAASWLGKPEMPLTYQEENEPIPYGGTPDLSTLYFGSQEPILTADTGRHERGDNGWGFYEANNGIVSEAGVLPDGSIDPRGAAIAASANITNHVPYVNRRNNEIAAKGTRAFFVSPDPRDSRLGEPQLYVRETAPDGSKRTVLVSQSQLPGHVGEKDAVGPALGNAGQGGTNTEPAQYFFASADGSHAFFNSSAQLTSDAPEISIIGLRQPRESQYQGGGFTLTVDVSGLEETTALLPASATSAEIQSALEALPAVGAGHVLVKEEQATFTGLPPVTVTYNPALFLINQRGGPGTYTLTVEVDGVSQTTAPIKETASEAELQAALEALSNVGSGNVTVENHAASFASGVMDHAQVHLRGTAVDLQGAPVTGISENPIKTYDFDLNTNKLTYVPGVGGELLSAASDGSWLLFENRSVSPSQVEIWTRATNTVTPIGQLPGGNVTATQIAGGNSAVAFETAGGIAGFNNRGGGVKEVYRYGISDDELTCVSCPPKGVVPTGGSLSYSQPEWYDYEANGESHAVNETHDVSTDGSRVLFDTNDALVPQDTNGLEDTYEWENGNVFLISNGTSEEPSHLLDASPDGNDVFFATSQGLVPADTDGGFDVYDARVPHPGDNPPASAVPCEGDVCQGPPSIASLLGAPASATFNGIGNPTPAVKPAAATVKKQVTAKKKKKKKKKKKRKKSIGKATNKTKRGNRATRSISDSKAKG